MNYKLKVKNIILFLIVAVVVGNLVFFPNFSRLYERFLATPIPIIIEYFLNPFAYFLGGYTILLGIAILGLILNLLIGIINLITPYNTKIKFNLLKISLNFFCNYSELQLKKKNSDGENINADEKVTKTDNPKIEISESNLESTDSDGSTKIFSPENNPDPENEFESSSKDRIAREHNNASNIPRETHNKKLTDPQAENNKTDPHPKIENTNPINRDDNTDAFPKEDSKNDRSANKKTLPAKKSIRNQKISKTDWEEVNSRRMEIGKIGEEIIFRSISKNLKKWGYENTEEHIDHVSKTKGDGLGYDICTINKQGRRIFIEVKTTTSSSRLPFILTRNEFDFLSRNKSNYYIYRISDLNKEELTYDLDIYLGEDVLKHYTLTPQSYKVRSGQ